VRWSANGFEAAHGLNLDWLMDIALD